MRDKSSNFQTLLNYYFNEFSRLYFVIAASLTIVAFFFPPLVGLMIVTLVTGSIWVLIDSCGGIYGSLEFIRNRDSCNDEKLKNKNIHLVNIVWCLIMLAAALAFLIFGGSSLWVSILAISFGCSMWVYVFDNLQKDDWNNDDKVESITIDTYAWTLGGLGSVFIAIFFGFGLPYVVGLLGVICYIPAILIKLGQFIYNMSFGAIAPRIDNLEKDPLLQSQQTMSHDKSFEKEEQFKAVKNKTISGRSFAEFANFNANCAKGFELLMNIALSLFQNMPKLSLNIKEDHNSVSCAVYSKGMYRSDLIEAVVHKAAVKFNFNPIVFSGGDFNSHCIAVRTALKLGFTNITIATEFPENPEHAMLISLVSGIKTNYGEHNKVLSQIGLDGNTEILQKHILGILMPEQKDFFNRLMIDATNESQLKNNR